MDKTILTSKATVQQEEQWKNEEQDWERFNLLLDLMREGYVNGEIKLENLCLWAVTIAKEFEGSILPIMPTRGRDRLIGNMIMRAVSARPPDIKRNDTPETFRKLIAELVVMAHDKDGYKLVKDCGDDGAYEFVSELMKKLGVEIGESTVAKYYQKYKE